MLHIVSDRLRIVNIPFGIEPHLFVAYLISPLSVFSEPPSGSFSDSVHRNSVLIHLISPAERVQIGCPRVRPRKTVTFSFATLNRSFALDLRPVSPLKLPGQHISQPLRRLPLLDRKIGILAPDTRDKPLKSIQNPFDDPRLVPVHRPEDVLTGFARMPHVVNRRAEHIRHDLLEYVRIVDHFLGRSASLLLRAFHLKHRLFGVRVNVSAPVLLFLRVLRPPRTVVRMLKPPLKVECVILRPGNSLYEIQGKPGIRVRYLMCDRLRHRTVERNTCPVSDSKPVSRQHKLHNVVEVVPVAADLYSVRVPVKVRA